MNSSRTEQLELFHELIEQRFGLVFDQTRADQVAETFDARRAELNKTPSEYLALLHGDSEEWQTLAVLLTVPETYFFRGSDHFRALEEIVFPARMLAHGGEHILRMLSVGCASGEEPYTIAITCQEQSRQLAGWSTQIIGLDLSQAGLEKARGGIYSEWSLRATPPAARESFFKKTGKMYRLSREIVESVAFDLGNVLQLYAEGYRDLFDVVFFRNVLMYFSPEAAIAAISQIAHVLQPGGYLFLGPAESLRGISQDFHLCHTHDSFYYQRKPVVGELITHSTDASLPNESAATSRIVTMASSTAEILGLEDVSWFEAILESGRRIQELGDKIATGKKVLPSGEAVRELPKDSVEHAWQNLIRLLRQEKYDDAASLIWTLPKHIGEHKDILLLDAVLLLNHGDYKEAEARCRLLLDQNEMDATAHYVMALCREHQLDHEGASSHDRTAIYLDPSFAMPHLHLALLVKKRGELRAAKREFREAVRLLPQELDARLLMFSGGFGQRGLIQLCEREIESLEAA